MKICVLKVVFNRIYSSKMFSLLNFETYKKKEGKKQAEF